MTDRTSSSSSAARRPAGPTPRAGSRPDSRPEPKSSGGPRRPPASARGRRPETPLRQPRTVRVAVLATLAVVLAITLVPAIRSFVHQQGQIDALRSTVARQRSSVAELQQRQQQWNDPAYVEQQARQRLQFVKVGDKSYTVLGAPGAGSSRSGTLTPAATPGPAQPWYAKVWASVAAPDAYLSAGASGAGASGAGASGSAPTGK